MLFLKQKTRYEIKSCPNEWWFTATGSAMASCNTSTSTNCPKLTRISTQTQTGSRNWRISCSRNASINASSATTKMARSRTRFPEQLSIQKSRVAICTTFFWSRKKFAKARWPQSTTTLSTIRRGSDRTSFSDWATNWRTCTLTGPALWECPRLVSMRISWVSVFLRLIQILTNHHFQATLVGDHLHQEVSCPDLCQTLYYL